MVGTAEINRRGTMTVELDAPPITIQAAADAVRDAYDKVASAQREYDCRRQRMSIQATTRVRVDWGTAFVELIGAMVLLQEAMDRRGPQWAANRTRYVRFFKRADSGHEDCDRAWDAYQEARRSGDMAAVGAARAAWADALLVWHRDRYAERGKLDEKLVDQMRDDADESLLVDSDNAFPRPRTTWRQLADAGKERDRQRVLSREPNRTHGNLTGWTSVSR